MSRPTYWDYLQVERLLSLQGGLEGDESLLATDELHFIVVHQVYELWFKLVLRELRLASHHLAAPHVPEDRIPYVVHHLRRVCEILRLLVEQFRVVETLTPQDFLAFRDKLAPASGFQSVQMREIEVLLGLDDAQRVPYGEADALSHLKEMAAGSPDGEAGWARLSAARSQPTLRDALHGWLYRTPIQGSSPGDPGDEEVVERFLTEYVEASRRFHEDQAERAVAAWGGSPDAIRVRFAEAVEDAWRFLFAADVPEAERARHRRIRAGLLFIESYRTLPLLAWPRLLIDTVVELEEQLVLWRTRHARMVERTIGRRAGTGGSAGVEYLDRTAGYRVFGELWAVRTILLPRGGLPALEKPAFYGFAS